MPLSQGPCLLSRLWLTNLGLQAPQDLPRYDLKLALYSEDRERLKKEAATPERKVAGLVSKGTYLLGLFWAAGRRVYF